MLLITVCRSDFKIPISFHICDKIIEKENEILLYVEDTIEGTVTSIKDYSYYNILETETEIDEENLVNLFDEFNKKLDGLVIKK